MTALTSAVMPLIVARGVLVGVGGKPADVDTRAYAVIWPDSPMRDPVTMNLTHAYVETWTTHGYGLSEEAAGIARDAVTDAVYALWGAEVGGRVVQYPEHLTTLPLSVDRDADPDLYSYTVEWRFRTSAA